MNEDKATRYQRLKRWASVMSLAWSAGLLVALVLSGWTLALRSLADRVSGTLGAPEALAPSIVVALYVLFLAALHELGSFPIDFYGGFALERRFGLATERFGRWLRDRAKGSLLGFALGVPGAVFTYAVLRALPAWWWIAAGGSSPPLTYWAMRATTT